MTDEGRLGETGAARNGARGDKPRRDIAIEVANCASRSHLRGSRPRWARETPPGDFVTTPDGADRLSAAPPRCGAESQAPRRDLVGKGLGGLSAAPGQPSTARALPRTGRVRHGFFRQCRRAVDTANRAAARPITKIRAVLAPEACHESIVQHPYRPKSRCADGTIRMSYSRIRASRRPCGMCPRVGRHPRPDDNENRLFKYRPRHQRNPRRDRQPRRIEQRAAETPGLYRTRDHRVRPIPQGTRPALGLPEVTRPNPATRQLTQRNDERSGTSRASTPKNTLRRCLASRGRQCETEADARALAEAGQDRRLPRRISPPKKAGLRGDRVYETIFADAPTVIVTNPTAPARHFRGHRRSRTGLRSPDRVGGIAIPTTGALSARGAPASNDTTDSGGRDHPTGCARCSMFSVRDIITGRVSRWSAKGRQSGLHCRHTWLDHSTGPSRWIPRDDLDLALRHGASGHNQDPRGRRKRGAIAGRPTRR